MKPESLKPITFLGDSRKVLQAFPDGPRYRAGVELRALQKGFDPDDWKPMSSVGPGVREIRIKDRSGACRILYLAVLSDRVLVLHAFQKKTQQTAQHDIALAAQRLKEWRAEQCTSRLSTPSSKLWPVPRQKQPI